MTTTIQDVKSLFLAKIARFLWRHRMIRGVSGLTRIYIQCIRKSSRWWFQVSSLMLMSVVLIYITVAFSFALLQNQALNHAGQAKLLNLESAMQHRDESDTFALVLAQKALLEHINQAKQYNHRFPLVQRLGVNTERTQVCPFSKMLLSSIEEGFILPTLTQLEEGLSGFQKNWSSQGAVTRNFLYPVYLENFQFYTALKKQPTELDFERLALFWYQSLNVTDSEPDGVKVEDLQALLAYYFQRKANTISLNTELIASVEKQLEGFS
jgi:hypothetical protein